MASPSGLTREALEAVFDQAELITVPEDRLGPVTDSDAKEVLRTLGFPVFPNPWFGLAAEMGERLSTVGEEFDWELGDRYDDVPAGADRWILLATFHYETIVLDPDSGTIHCLPQDAEIYLFNSSLRKFVHFLCILQAERPHFDVEWDGDDPFDPQGAQQRVEAAMRSVDPAALENPESCWFYVLKSIVDPEYDY
jgi:hypothetical protein